MPHPFYANGMLRHFLFPVLAILALLMPGSLVAMDEGPPISITSPDQGTTFAYGEIKNHELIWNKNTQMLSARVTFTDAQFNVGQPNDDIHFFRLPGITFDPAKGIFYAMSAKGVAIPVAFMKKTLFFKTVQATANANVRIIRERGQVTVILEAISPDDPSLRPVPADTSTNDTHKVDINKIIQ